MDVLIDTNVILDWFLERENFFEDSSKVIYKCWFGNIKTYITVHSICDIFYLMKRTFSLDEKKNMISLLLNKCEVMEDSKTDIQTFVESEVYDDLEDFLQIQCAQNLKLNYVITRNIKDFENCSVKVVTPTEFLELIK